jgi:hypothetical protein
MSERAIEVSFEKQTAVLRMQLEPLHTCYGFMEPLPEAAGPDSGAISFSFLSLGAFEG